MKLACAGAPHLTYCTNIHPGERWAEVKQGLATHLLAIRAQTAPGLRFGVGLRLSARAAEELAAPAELEAFRDFLDRNDLYVFTINGFPYGPFHGEPVKERVYLPDWLDDERLDYTDRLARLLGELLPTSEEERLSGSVSTVPGAFKPRVRSPSDIAAIARRLVRHAATLVALRRRTGKRISLALEPEPCCFLETTPEAIAFFTRHVFSRDRAAELAALTGLSVPEAEEALHDHLGICFDACHMAVAYEDPAAALDALAAAGIRVPKIQLSAGLRVRFDEADEATLAKLTAYAEGVYLHQVVERRAEGAPLIRHLDLPDALASLDDAEPPALRDVGGRARRRAPRGLEEWRIHFHVPIFRQLAGALTTTQPDLAALLARLRDRPATQHLEVETYTWDVLPEEHRREGVASAVARELGWAREQLLGPARAPSGSDTAP